MHKHIALLKGLIVALGFFLFVFIALMQVLSQSIVKVDLNRSEAATVDLGIAFPQNKILNTTVKSGNWSDASVWANGIPKPEHTAVISSGHTVTLDLAQTHVSGIYVSPTATLAASPAISVTLTSSQNVVVEGIFRMRPQSASLIHTLRFANANGTGIDNFKFVGAGMDPMATDVGLWVMNTGKLDLEGSAKTSWTKAAGAISQGSSSISLATSPTGWRVGDEISISPTSPPVESSYSHTEFDEATITSLSGSTVGLSKSTQYSHPKVNNTWTAEVMNLTRNVRIEGMPPSGAYLGRYMGHEKYHNSHIFIRNTSTAIHTIKNVSLRYMGARGAQTSDQNSSPPTQIVMGRYVLHFHHSMHNNHGTIVENVVARNTGNKVFVPHASHGITFKGTVAYDIGDVAYWWDTPEGDRSERNENRDSFITDNTTYENCIGAKFNPIVRLGGVSPTIFLLGAGTNNTVRNCIAVGNTSRGQNASGFHWPSSVNGFPNVWGFSGNIMHNNMNHGIFTWQNTGGDHVVSNFAAYHNGSSGIDHGAYGNHYRYENFTLFGNLGHGLQQHSQSGKGGILKNGTGKTQTFARPTIVGGKSAVYLPKHSAGFIDVNVRTSPYTYTYLWPTEEGSPTIYNDCDFRGQSIAKIYVNEPSNPPSGETPDNPSLVYFIRCNLTPADFFIDQVHPLSVFKVQNTDTPVNGSYGFIMKFDANQNPIITDLKCELPENDKELVDAILANSICKVGSTSTDTTLPTVSITSPAAGTTITGIKTLAATASDNGGIAGITFKVDGTAVAAEDTTSPYSISWNSALVSNGSHVISATARDTAGNTKTASITVTVSNTTTVPDTTPPTISLTSPTAGATVTGQVNLSATATDNKAVVGVQFKVDNVAVGAEDTVSPYTYSWNSALVSNGSHVISATARDAAGNTQVSSRTVTVSNTTTVTDTTLPTVSLTSPAAGATVNGTITISATASDNVGVTKVQFKVNGFDQGAADTTAPYATSWNTASVSNTTYFIQAVAYDAAGNTKATQSITVTVSNDKTAPTVSLSSPASGATVSATTTISATAQDNVGVVGVTFKVDGVTVSAEDTTSPYSVSWNTKTISNGSHTITATARDAAGNTQVSSRTVTVSNTTQTTDTTNPNISLTSPDSGSTVKGTITVSAAATDNVGVTEVQFRLNGALLGSKDTTSPYSVSWDTTQATEGSNTLTAEAKDAAGNVKLSSTVTVTVDNVQTSTSGGGGGGGSSSSNDDDDDEDEDDDDVVVVVPPVYVPPSVASYRVVSTSNLSVRTQPGTAYPLISVVPTGTQGTVLDGPVYVYGYAWLKVQFDSGVVGWSSRTWLQNVIAAPTYTPTYPAPISPSTLTDAQKAQILTQILELYKQVAILQAQLAAMQN